MKWLYFIFIITISIVSGCSDNSSNSNKESNETEKIVWDMPTPYVDSIFHTKNIVQFADDIKRLTNGRLTINIHSGASLYKHAEIKRAVRSGQVPIGESLISLYGNEDPLYQIDVLPLLATSYDSADKLWEASQMTISTLLKKQGVKLLFSVPWPPQGLYVKKEINTMDDLKGLKIRAYNALLSRLVELLGAIPAMVETPEVPQAFSTGIIDSMMTSPSTGVSSQAWDYVQYYYDFQAWIPKNMVIVNQEAMDALPKDIHDIVIKVAQDAEKRGWEMSKRETIEKIDILKEHGIKVLPPTKEVSKGLTEIRKKIALEWQEKAGEQGAKLLEQYNEALGDL
jgi:TRAP-type C4-dicarboxylate transport system substrate-binding protein